MAHPRTIIARGQLVGETRYVAALSALLAPPPSGRRVPLGSFGGNSGTASAGIDRRLLCTRCGAPRYPRQVCRSCKRRNAENRQ